jgi:Periplasmic binding protein-like domain
LSAAQEAGFLVPEDLTVVGFDDIAMAGWPALGLTTVHCDLAELARQSVELLMGRITGTGETVAERQLAPTLVLRTTHGPPRGSGTDAGAPANAEVIARIAASAVTSTRRGHAQGAWRATSNISADGGSRPASALTRARVDALVASR